jgi:hypothetical protein
MPGFVAIEIAAIFINVGDAWPAGSGISIALSISRLPRRTDIGRKQVFFTRNRTPILFRDDYGDLAWPK